MMHMIINLSLIGLFLALVSPSISKEKSEASKGEYKVIVNGKNTLKQLSREDLARIFLGKKTLWDSETKIMPAILPEKEKVTQVFIKKVIRKSISQYRAYWKRRLFSGGGTPPKTFRTSQEVLDFVAKHPGAIGVVEASVNEDKKVKVLAVAKKKKSKLLNRETQ